VSAILDAIDQELAIARERVNQLEDLRDRASAIDGTVPDVPLSAGGGIVDPPPKRRRRRQRQKRAQKPKPSAPKPAAITNRERGEQLRDAILAHLRETGGAQVKEIAEALSLDPQKVRSQLPNMASNGLVRVEVLGSGGKTSPRLYRPAESDIAPPDQNGARTGPERQVVEAVSGVELTESEIAANTEIPEHRVREILAGLCRRGVLARDGKLYGVAA